MEPVAPGTEDDQPVTFSSSTKQERERERLLSEKAILPNGRYGNVFEFKYQNGAEHWYCNACACPVMGWVFHHEVGRRHKSAVGISSEDKFNPSQEAEESVILVAPGEPVPPGFEGQVDKVAAIQERLDDFHVGPLVALEYLLELKDYDANKEPAYLCVLCDKKGDPRTVLTHLASYKHIQQYLQKHFPTSYRALAPYMTKQYKRNWQEALHKVAEAIEKQFGRLKPMPIDGDKYEKDPGYYLGVVAKGRHFSELSGYTFEELVQKDALTKVHEDEEDPFSSLNTKAPQKKKSPSPPVVANPIKRIKHCSNRDASSSTAVPSAAVGSRRRSLSSVSSISSSDLSDGDGKSRNSGARDRGKRRSSRSPEKSRPRSRSPGKRFDNRRHVPRRDGFNRDRESKRGGYQKDDRGLLPWERSNYRRASSKSDSSEKIKLGKIDEYRKLCRAIDNDMERVLKVHKKNPEKHPQYNDEWKSFWNRRYKELQGEGKDVSKHDFKPEWIEFWSQRMSELHQDEIKVKKEALKKRLGLEEPAPISFKIGGGASGRKKSEESKDSPNSKPMPTAAMPDNDPEIIIIEDKDEKSSKRSHSPWEDEPIPIRRKSVSKEKTTKPSPVRASKDRLIKDKGSKDRLSSERVKERPSRDKQERVGRSRRSPDRGNSFERRDRSPKSRERDRYSRSRSRSWEREYSKKPWERDRDRDRDRSRRGMSDLPPWERSSKRDIPECYKPPPVMRDVTRKPVLSPRLLASPPPPPIEDVDDGGEINVVSVLRLLTALEEKLGSLGPKIIDLLTQALAMEKNEANSSETLLDNEIYCVMFETVKEKLKGQLLAGLVDYVQERAFKNAIKKIAGLVHMAGERKKEMDKVKSKIKVDPVKVPGVGTVDKSAIARQIATALVSQGKTDVTQAELEQLINAVVGMAEASRKSNKPITTASFLEQITQKSESSVEAKKEKSPSPPRKLDPPPRKASPVPEKPSGPPSMEGLSDSDLQTLLQNFKDLSTEEQHGLINYLKKLEAHEPDRVERLRKFVNIGSGGAQPQPQNKKPVPPVAVEKPKGRESPFAKRSDPVNPIKTDTDIVKIPIDSDEDDYSFEDVVKAASNNVKQKELEKKRESEMSFDDTKALISNIMSNIKKNDSPTQQPAPSLNLFGLDNSTDLAKTLTSLPVDMASLASIVGNVQSLTNTRPVAAPSTITANIAPKLSFQLPSINYPPAGQMSEARLRGDEPLQTYPTQQQQQPPPPARQNFEPRPPQGFNQGFYQGNQHPVQYPQLDTAKVAYPNYAMYNRGPGPEQPQGRFGGGNDQGRFGGGNDQPRFGGGNDQPRFGGGNDQPRFGGGNDQGRFGGGNDPGRFVGGNDQGRFTGGNEQGRFGGGNDRRGPPNQPPIRGGPGNNRGGNYSNSRW